MWRELAQVHRARERKIQRMDVKFAKMLAAKRPDDELNQYNDLLIQERTIYVQDIAQLESMRLIMEAENLRVPIPAMDDNHPHWQRTTHPGLPVWLRHVLTDMGMKELRSAIRAEKKERSELARAWLASIAAVIGACTGLIGVLIGLAAVILGKR
jgi:hypothetical protein